MIPDARVILVRHAEPADRDLCHGSISDPGLSRAGQGAARTLGLRMRVLGRDLGGVTRVLTSPAARSIESVAEVAVQLDKTPAVDDRWRERSFGEWEGKPWSELWPTAPAEVQQDPAAYAAWSPPGAETPDEVADRVTPALHDALQGEGLTVVMTHAGAIRQALAVALDVDLATTLKIDVPYARAVVIGRIGDSMLVERVGI